MYSDFVFKFKYPSFQRKQNNCRFQITINVNKTYTKSKHVMNLMNPLTDYRSILGCGDAFSESSTGTPLPPPMRRRRTHTRTVIVLNALSQLWNPLRTDLMFHQADHHRSISSSVQLSSSPSTMSIVKVKVKVKVKVRRRKNLIRRGELGVDSVT